MRFFEEKVDTQVYLSVASTNFLSEELMKTSWIANALNGGQIVFNMFLYLFPHQG